MTHVRTSFRENTGQASVHGVLVVVFGLGVLIVGRSGIGKSACALELVSHGHRLVADDVVNVEVVEDSLHGRAPHLFKGLLEVRGLGICDIRELFDPGSLVSRHRIDLCVEFQNEEPEAARTETRGQEFEASGVRIPKVSFHIDGSRDRRILVETAAKYFLNNGSRAERNLITNHNKAVGPTAESSI